MLSINAISSVQGREQTYMGMYDVGNQCRRHLLSITPRLCGCATDESIPFHSAVWGERDEGYR